MSNVTRKFATGFWSQTAVGTNAGASATQAAVTGKIQVLEGLDASGDAAALVTVESPSGTVLWKKRFAAAFNTNASFPEGDISGASGAALIVKISASTSNCEVNGYGYTVAG